MCCETSGTKHISEEIPIIRANISVKYFIFLEYNIFTKISNKMEYAL